MADDLQRRLAAAIERGRGAVFARPALVGRNMYTGRDILAPNSRIAPGIADARGCVPVEWWIMSTTPAAGDVASPGEGITRLKLPDGEEVALDEAAARAGALLFGPYRERWPLTKVLDIGGEPVVPDFGPFGGAAAQAEVPPIPVHVHAGEVVQGHIRPPGKLESYFFLPPDVPPYGRQLGRVVSRLGLRPGADIEAVRRALAEFGRSDAMYALGAVYEVRPYEGWLVPPGTLHAPGPWPTMEVQLPQDDFNFLAWRMGERPDDAERERLRRQMMLRGLPDEEALLREAVDWEVSRAPDFARRFHRRAQELESGAWGRRLQIFFEPFYGEGLEIRPGRRYVRRADPRPWAGIVWSGEGLLNGTPIAARGSGGEAEWLVVPGHDVELVSTGDHPLLIYTVFPRT